MTINFAVLPKLKIPFGLKDGRLYDPIEVPNGSGCGCLCPGCYSALIAYNQGRIKRPYFGHATEAVCHHGFESALHMAGKQVLLDAKAIVLPALVIDGEGIVHSEQIRAVSRTIEPITKVNYDDVFAEISLDVTHTEINQATGRKIFRPDVTASNAFHFDFIEIRVTHEVDEAKLRAFRRAGMRVIEVDLRPLMGGVVNLQAVREQVIEQVTNKKWLTHPEVETECANLRDEIEAKRLEILERVRRTQKVAQSIVSAPSTHRVSTSVQTGPSVPPASHYDRNHEEHRTRLGLKQKSDWPQFLNLNMASNGGSNAPTYIWLGQMYLDWIYDYPGASIRISDLERSAEKFGCQSPYGSANLKTNIRQRVIPYWVKCGLIRTNAQGKIYVSTQR